jgi:cyanophycin synthetase
MKIGNIRAIPGPNIYSHRPVLVMRLYLDDLNERESREFPGFNQRLLELLPGIQQHVCSKGYAGGFVERLEEGTYFGHIVEHVALEFTELAGVPTFHGKTRQASEPASYDVIVEYKAQQGTEYLLRTAVKFVEALVRGESFALEEEIREAQRIIARTELGPSTRTIVEAAEAFGIPWHRLDKASLIQLGYGRNRRLIAAAMTSQTSALAVDIASDKELTKQLLKQAGIPVPQGEIVHTPEEAVSVLEWLHKPVVVKPYDGHQGEGVSLNLYTPAQVKEAFAIASQHTKDVLVEELFLGRDFRVLVINGRMVAASERIPAHVVGDGSHSIAELIEIENRHPLRGEGHGSALTKIVVDQVIMAYLEKSGLRLEHIPETGKKVFLRENANLSQGGTAIDVTDIVHPSIKRICERAAGVIGLDICGIDLVLPSIAEPIRKGGAGIIEVNAAPGLRMHVHPSEGQAREVGRAIIEMLYPAGTPARIPVISVTGTNGKTTITRLITNLIAASGETVGMTTTDGIYLNDELIFAGDTTGPRSTQMILSDPSVDVAVLEVARGGIMRGGLAYDWSDISVLSNIQPDHIGQDGITSVEDILYVKSLVAERVREGGTLILNADDERLARLMETPRVSKVPKSVIYYSLDPDHPLLQQHTARGGTAYTVQNGWVVQIVGDQQHTIIEVAAVAITLGGQAGYQISNTLAAIAAARTYGLSRKQIVKTLESYSGQQNSGRGNLYTVGKGYVYVDYGHNPEAFTAVGKSLRALHASRLTAVLSVPGDRNDEVIQQNARAVAQYFDQLIIKEDKDLRGRVRGEVSRLLARAAEQASPGIKCQVVLDEQEALELALREMQEEEMIVVFYEKIGTVKNVLDDHHAQPIAATSLRKVAASK